MRLPTLWVFSIDLALTMAFAVGQAFAQPSTTTAATAGSSTTATAAPARDETTATLATAEFEVASRTTYPYATREVRALGSATAEVLEARLYGRVGETTAPGNASRSKFTYDPDTLLLSVTESPENLAAIKSFLDGLEKPRKLWDPPTTVTRTLTVNEEITFRDLRMRVIEVSKNRADPVGRAIVKVVIRTATQASEDREFPEMSVQRIEDVEIRIHNAEVGGSPDTGRAQVELRQLPRPLPTPTPVPQVVPFTPPSSPPQGGYYIPPR